MRPSWLTYANVMATIAVFIALGGASLAALKIPNNSVGSKQLKSNAVTTAKIKDGAVTGAKVDLSTLGPVPNATAAVRAVIADNATHAGLADTAVNALTVQGLAPAEIKDLKLRCPSDTVLAAGVCFETTQRPAEPWEQANVICAKEGRRMPSAEELIAYEVKAYPTTPPPLEWAGGLVYSSGAYGMVLFASSSVGVGFEFKGFLASEPFRCATNPLN
jgi:hypothetical protein